MLLKIYIISTLISFVVVIFAALAVRERQKREYPDMKVGKTSGTFEKILIFMKIFTPVLNVYIAIVCIFGFEMVYNGVIKMNLKKDIGRRSNETA